VELNREAKLKNNEETADPEEGETIATNCFKTNSKGNKCSLQEMLGLLVNGSN
jgi:hypothetical protein